MQVTPQAMPQGDGGNRHAVKSSVWPWDDRGRGVVTPSSVRSDIAWLRHQFAATLDVMRDVVRL